MGLTEKISLGVFALFLFVVVVRVFHTPLKLMMRVFFNTLLGFGALSILNLTSTVTGIALGVNVLNAVVIGILGVPGPGLLLLMQWLFV